MSNADRMQDRRHHPGLTPSQGLGVQNHVLLTVISAVSHLSLRIGWGLLTWARCGTTIRDSRVIPPQIRVATTDRGAKRTCRSPSLWVQYLTVYGCPCSRYLEGDAQDHLAFLETNPMVVQRPASWLRATLIFRRRWIGPVGRKLIIVP